MSPEDGFVIMSLHLRSVVLSSPVKAGSSLTEQIWNKIEHPCALSRSKSNAEDLSPDSRALYLNCMTTELGRYPCKHPVSSLSGLHWPHSDEHRHRGQSARILIVAPQGSNHEILKSNFGPRSKLKT